MTIKAILWDFGDTLVDERWMRAPLAGVPAWPDAYRDMPSDLADRWNIGEITSRDVAAAFARKLGCDMGVLHDHMEACCRKLIFFPRAMELVERCPLPQAIVTINPDIFSDIVAPHYKLSSCFPVIVTSWQERNLYKSALCDIAIRQLGLPPERGECLLIDNRSDNVADWIARGGVAYHFQGEDRLQSDLSKALSR